MQPSTKKVSTGPATHSQKYLPQLHFVCPPPFLKFLKLTPPSPPFVGWELSATDYSKDVMNIQTVVGKENLKILPPPPPTPP